MTLSAASKEFITLKPGDFGFADAKDKDSLRSVILDFSTFGLDDLTMSDRELTLAEKTTKQVEVTYQQLANGYISVKAGAIASTKTIAFQVRDDGGTANDGIDTSLATNTLSVLATPPASNDKEILNMIRVGQALAQLEESLPPGERDPDVMKAANGLSSENRELFLEKFDSGLFDGAVDRARRFVYANIESQENLEAEKSDLEAQLAELQASADQSELDQSKIEALQSRLESLSSTLEQYTSLVPDVSLLDSLVQTDADGNPLPIDMDQLRSSLGDAAGDVISEANDEGNVDIKVGNSTSITMSQEELAELLASKQDTFQDSLKQGFSDANEGTKAQIKTIAAAETFGATDSETAANYDAAAKEFLAAGVTIADVLDTGDPALTSKAKDLVSDGDAESLAKARATLETVESPFGGAATITAADLINEATRIKRTFADAILTEVDTLGTAELAHTNAAYIGALDGNVAGQPGVTFSADSKTMVFTFPLSPGQTQTTQILSYLAGGKDIYAYEQAVDDNGDPRFESDDTTPIYALDDNGNKIVSGFSEAALETDAGYAEGSYDTYLKYVSYDDLLKYGATPTGTIDADTEEMIFSWGDSSSWGDETNSLNTADSNPLTLLSKPADLDSSSDNYIDYVITKPGWYDFTQVGGSGDGAKYVTVTQEIDGEAVTRIVGVELNFSRDMFGDKTPGDDQITDPGATVAVVPKGNGQLAADESAINTAELEQLRAQAAATTAAGGAGGGGAGLGGLGFPPKHMINSPCFV